MLPLVVGLAIFLTADLAVAADWLEADRLAVASAVTAVALGLWLGRWHLRRTSATPSDEFQQRLLPLTHVAVPRPVSVADRLTDAVGGGEIVPHYQAIVDLASGQVVGAEALARWPDAPDGFERPEAFLGLASDLGLMPMLTDQMLRSVCRDFASGEAVDPRWWVALNLAAAEATSGSIGDQVRAALNRTGLHPSRLVLEVSERLVPDPTAAQALAPLADLGVSLAIDDFGSGWSTLAQLRALPIELVKIDRSVVAEAVTSPKGPRLLAAVASLAEALNLAVLAEGIETETELAVTRAAGIDLGQGFRWGGAVPLSELVDAAPASGGERASTCDDGRRARPHLRPGRHGAGPE